MFPGPQQFYAADAADLEKLVGTGLHIIGPHIHVILPQLVRFQQEILGSIRAGRRIVLQHHLLLPLGGIHQARHILRISLVAQVIRHGCSAVNHPQFLLQVLLHHIAVVNVLDEVTHQNSLLLGEVHQLGEVTVALVVGSHPVHALPYPVYYETGILERVDIAEKGPFGDTHVTGDFVQ